MDATPQYSNILSALAKKSEESKLSAADRVENYNLLEKLNAQGIKLSDLVKKAEQSNQKEDDAELFSLMEATVKNDEEVKNAKQRLMDAKSSVLTRICYQYPEYKAAIDEYRATVSRTYRAKVSANTYEDSMPTPIDLPE